MLTQAPAAKPPGALGRRDWLVVLFVGAAFLASCAAARGGFFSASIRRRRAIPRLRAADAEGSASLPEFYMEYPPGAIPTFLAPLALSRLAHYNPAFKFTVAVAGLGLIIACAVGLRLLVPTEADWSRRTGSSSPLPVALGGEPTATTCGRAPLCPALDALLAGRSRLGFGLLALGSS